MDNLLFVFWTTNKNVQLMEITLDYFFKHNHVDKNKVVVMGNDFSKNKKLPYSDKVKYLSAGIEYDIVGKHFGNSLAKLLPDIKEDYIFFCTDDYIFIRDTKANDFKTLMDFIEKENIKYFGFDEFMYYDLHYKRYAGKQPDIFENELMIRNKHTRHLFSVQPCIWHRKSLLNIVESNPGLSLHDIDETIEEIKNNTDIEAFCTNLNSHFTLSTDDYTDDSFKYFVIAYIEIVRHGVFFHPHNGQHLPGYEKTIIFEVLNEIIRDYDLNNREEFKRHICDIKV